MNALPPPGTRVVIYARYSTDLQSFKSIEDQIALCRAFAERHGWIVVDVFFDAERSGTTMVGRDGFFSMMAAAERGEFTLLLAEDLDRLSRSAADTHSLVDDLEALDIGICTVASGMASDLEVAFAAVKNQHFIKGLAQKVRRGQEGTVRSGRLSANVAYGTRKVFSPDGVKGLRELHPDQAPVVARIFRDYVAGVSTFAICKALNDEGVPPPKGKKWGPHALTGTKKFGGGILRNRLYIGQFHWGRTRTKRNRKKRRPTVRPAPASEHIVIEVPHLRIVDDALFEAAQARLEERSLQPTQGERAEADKGAFRGRRHPDYLFTGKPVCGVCGGAMVVMAGRFGCTTHRINDGACPNGRRVGREELEEAVLAGLKDQLVRPELIEPCFAEYRAELDRALIERRQKAEAGKARLKEIEQLHANAFAHLLACAPDSLARPPLEAEVARLEGERQRLGREAAQAPPSVGHNLTPDAMVEQLGALLGDLRQALSGPEAAAVCAKDRLRGMIDKITVIPIAEDRPDGRGAGPVRLVVEGSLARMLQLAEAHVGRVIQEGSGPRPLLEDSTWRFRYHIDLQEEDLRALHTLPDVQAIVRLLDPGDVPVTTAAITAALTITPVAPHRTASLKSRIVIALEYLKRRALVRWISVAPKTSSGWVWDHYPFTDEEWIARANAVARPSPITRLKAPKAHVVVISDPPRRATPERRDPSLKLARESVQEPI